MQKNKDGKLPIPTPHDVSGSAHFWNKADNCITVWRNQADYLDQRVQIHVQKVRFKHIGRIGMTELLYDRVTGRYNERPGNVMDFKPKGNSADF
jgi:twinkle protein